MAVFERISPSERAIGCSLRLPECGSSGGLTELEDWQLCRANLPHVARHVDPKELATITTSA